MGTCCLFLFFAFPSFTMFSHVFLVRKSNIHTHTPCRTLDLPDSYCRTFPRQAPDHNAGEPSKKGWEPGMVLRCHAPIFQMWVNNHQMLPNQYLYLYHISVDFQRWLQKSIQDRIRDLPEIITSKLKLYVGSIPDFPLPALPEAVRKPLFFDIAEHPEYPQSCP